MNQIKIYLSGVYHLKNRFYTCAIIKPNDVEIVTNEVESKNKNQVLMHGLIAAFEKINNTGDRDLDITLIVDSKYIINHFNLTKIHSMKKLNNSELWNKIYLLIHLLKVKGCQFKCLKA